MYDEIVLNIICKDIFELNRVWYAKYEHDDTGKLVYRPLPLEDVWLNEQDFRDCMHELENQHRHQEDHIREKNSTMPDIIPLNTKDNDARPHMGAPVSENYSIVDPLLGHPPTESEGDFVSDDSNGGAPSYPSPASNIPSLYQPSTPNTSQEVDISREGYQAEPKYKYQRKQWPESVW